MRVFACLIPSLIIVRDASAGSADVVGLMRSIILQVYFVYNSGLEDIAVIRKEAYGALLVRFQKLVSGTDAYFLRVLLFYIVK